MTTVRGQLLEMLKVVATTLEQDLRDRLVFVGGCTTALFITDPVTLEDVRATDDIDLIVDLAGLAEWGRTGFDEMLWQSPLSPSPLQQ